jgi:hypothetical protein
MADITITIPDEFVPGAVAKMYDMNRTREVPYADLDEFLTDYATSLASGACVDYKVGPYYIGPIEPQFNQDGTPVNPPLAEEVVVVATEPVDEIPVVDETPVVEEVVTEPAVVVNDTTVGG